jgi:vesicle coat complex subunit
MADSHMLQAELEAVRKQLLEVLEGSPEAKAKFVQKALADSPNIKSEIELLLKEVREMLATMAESRAKYLTKVAGKHLGILASPDDIMSYLNDQNPKVRQAALVISSERWPLNPAIAKTCEHLALNDPIAEVRAEAAGSLGTCFANSFNSRVSRLLAGILIDEQNPRILRLSAYVALLEVQGKSLLNFTPTLRDIRDFRFPEGVHWRFVEEFA